jgi:hypothetical protein
MILALITSKIYKKGFQAGPNYESPGIDLGFYYYNLELKDLHDYLAKKQDVKNKKGIEAIIAIIFL